MLHVEWCHVCWPRLTAKRVEPVVSISWASCWAWSSGAAITVGGTSRVVGWGLRCPSAASGCYRTHQWYSLVRTPDCCCRTHTQRRCSWRRSGTRRCRGNRLCTAQQQQQHYTQEVTTGHHRSCGDFILLLVLSFIYICLFIYHYWQLLLTYALRRSMATDILIGLLAHGNCTLSQKNPDPDTFWHNFFNTALMCVILGMKNSLLIRNQFVIKLTHCTTAVFVAGYQLTPLP